MQQVALIGLGIMGAGMAHNLLRAGVPLTVYNRNAEKSAPLANAGARVAASATEAATGADVVIAMLSNDDASREIWTAADGALAGVKAGAILIESSTLTPTWIRELSALGHERGCSLLDAPVSGSKPQAEAGELAFFVGGDAPTLEKVRPLLEAMGKRIHHLGPVGSGAEMKIVNNLMGGVQIAALAEGLVLAERAGLNKEQVLDLLMNGAPGSPIVRSKLQKMADHDYETNFALRWMEKDLSYALAEAERNGMRMSVVAAARALYRSGSAMGLSDQDFSAVAEVVRNGER
ncbi:MAG: NAD(P)-dependent oxidoreductase [Herpetosiphon sp.]